MRNEDKKISFPVLKRSIEDFMYEEEGNITRNKMLTIGSMVLIMGIVLSQDVFAAHSSHSSHKSHSSSRTASSHSSHESHSSHSSSVTSSAGGSTSSYSYGGTSSSTSSNTYVEPTTVTTTEYVPAPSAIGVPKTPEPTTVSATVPEVNAVQAIPSTPDVK
jgi:hypothetical protein